jgi:hypothetical protein
METNVKVISTATLELYQSKIINGKSIPNMMIGLLSALEWQDS